MTARSVARVSGDELGMRPRNYGHLQGLAARYALARLHGRRVVNQGTGRSIVLDWSRGLKKAVAPGTPPELLLMLPAMPAMLAQAISLGPIAATENQQQTEGHHRLHGFGVRVEVTGRPIDVWVVARDEGQGELHFDRIIPRVPLVASTEDGGRLPNTSGVRSRALQAVLARAKIPGRQNGGGTEDLSGDGGSEFSMPEALPDEAPAQTSAGSSPQVIANDETGFAPSTQLALAGDECEEQYHDDLQICRSLPKRTKQEQAARSRCWDSAENRLWNCNNGKQIPPLVTWREPASPTPQPWLHGAPPMIIPTPPGGGGGGGFPRLVPGLPLYLYR